jgi:rod shape determining protein RodA
MVIAAIGLFGLVILFSAAGGSLTPWAANQGARFALFFVAMIALARIHPERWSAMAFPLYAVILAALMAVELMGAIGGGSQRWLDLGFIRLQPSEFMKPVVILVLARFYSRLPAVHLRSMQALWPAVLLLGVPAALVITQPDLGTALMIVFGGVTVMFLAGLPLWWFLGTGGLIAAALPILYTQLHEYQQRRVLIFLDPESDPLGAGYHISQSKIAIGSGGFFGKGFLNGTQSHLEYLPEMHTDFAFATMAEEWGLMGGLLLLAAFAYVLGWGWRLAISSEGRFERLLAGGLTASIFFYVCINLMMVMGLAPVVGIPLPFISYGGSAMMTVMLCLGVLLGIDRANRRGSALRQV